MRVIGLMSGTSYDGIDAAAADLTREGDALVLSPLGSLTCHYGEELRALLAAALPPSPTSLYDVCRLDTLIGRSFAGTAERAVRELCGGEADLVVSHGQTVYHWAEGGRVHGTLQLGEAAWIAEGTGLPVVSGLRTRDVAAGGQGAPLVSAVDLLWLRGRPGTPVALNLGGIANLTVPHADTPLAFDTGPANALMDAAVVRLTGGERHFDRDGALAAAGQVHEPLLRTLLADPYYALPAPKTTGKELFHPGYLRDALASLGEDAEKISAEDLLATLVRLTAVTAADAIRGAGATEVIASGGGTRNPALLAALRAELGAGVPVRLSDELGLPSAAKEPFAFAVLGYLTAHALPGTVPACTGARHASVLGSLTPGAYGFPRVPPEAQAAPAIERLRVHAPA
ncbi:anhydro-N-acetylmuramic acid kinase [Streptomyces sp. ODS28]|uniref:anhydro-N-acetylmuramic acid kinase n=1 Tax=Streptomyces sp. ODS28 TaxID=3136688 RepID=UPI0031ED9FB3